MPSDVSTDVSTNLGYVEFWITLHYYSESTVQRFFSLSASYMKALFFKAVMEVCLLLYKVYSKPCYNIMIALIRTKYMPPRKALQFLGGLQNLNCA